MAKQPKLKELLEGIFEDKPQINKFEVVEGVKSFNIVGKSLYNNSNIMEIAKQVSHIAEIAHSQVLSETDDWFDQVSVNKNLHIPPCDFDSDSDSDSELDNSTFDDGDDSRTLNFLSGNKTNIENKIVNKIDSLNKIGEVTIFDESSTSSENFVMVNDCNDTICFFGFTRYNKTNTQ